MSEGTGGVGVGWGGAFQTVRTAHTDATGLREHEEGLKGQCGWSRGGGTLVGNGAEEATGAQSYL